MVNWHIDVVRAQSGELTFVCYVCDPDAQDANCITPAFSLSEGECKLGEFRIHLGIHPVAHPGGVPMQQWGGNVAQYCREYTQGFFAHQDLVDCYQKIRQAGEGLRIIIQTHEKYMHEVRVANDLLSTPLEFLCSPDAGPITDVTQWLQGVFLLKHPVERWIIRFPGKATDESSTGGSSQPDFFPRPRGAGFNPAETKLLLISSWDSKITDDDKSGETDPLSEEVEQVSEYFGKYFNKRLSTESSFINTNGVLLESNDWQLKKARKQVFRQKLREANFIYLPNPLRPLLVATLENLEPGTKLIIHYVGMVEPNGLRVKSPVKDPCDHTLFAGVLDSLLTRRLTEVQLLFVSCYFTGKRVPFGDFLNTMAQSLNVLNLVSFRWPVWDRIASEVTRTLYDSLESLTPDQAWTNLSYAIWQARQTIYGAYCASKEYAQNHYYCWAAPVLIRQAVGRPHPAQEKGRALSEEECKNLENKVDGAYKRLEVRLVAKYHKARDIAEKAQREVQLEDLDHWQRKMAKKLEELRVDLAGAKYARDAQQVRRKLGRVVSELTRDLDNLG